MRKYLKGLLLATAAPVSLALLIIGCGSGGGSTATGSGGSGGSGGVISGAAVKGPVAGATVTAYSVNANGTMGGAMGSGATDNQGNFSVAVGNYSEPYSGPVVLRMTGGHYIDEATGTDMPMAAGDVMAVAIPYMEAATGMGGVNITPLTSMAQAMVGNMPGGMTPANINNANGAMGRYYDIADIVLTRPIDPTASGSGAGADQNAVNYGMFMAAVSAYANTVGMPYSSGMVTAMVEDASDGVMDGLMWGAGITLGGGMMGNIALPPDAGTIGMADSMAQFLNSPYNMSGVASGDMLTLMDNMRSSGGTIQNWMTGGGPGGFTNSPQSPMVNGPGGGMTNSPQGPQNPMVNGPIYGGGPGGMM